MEKQRRPSSNIKVVGVHKKKPMKRNKKRHSFLKKVVSYFRTDCYMYAPLLSSRPSPKQISLTTAPGVDEAELPLILYGENKKKNLIEKVADFLTSDCYLYAPLLVPQQSNWSHSNKAAPQTGQAQSQQKAAATATATATAMHPVGKSAEETRPPTPPSKDKEDKKLDSFSPARNILRKRVAYSETVKHMVRLNCRTPSVPGVLHGTEPRKLLVE